MDVLPSGDHDLVTLQDCRNCRFDVNLSTRPYRTTGNHVKAVSAAKAHPYLPLFSDACGDALLHVFHATVYGALDKNALTLPDQNSSIDTKL